MINDLPRQTCTMPTIFSAIVFLNLLIAMFFVVIHLFNSFEELSSFFFSSYIPSIIFIYVNSL